jgi:hypothetical protein
MKRTRRKKMLYELTPRQTRSAVSFLVRSAMKRQQYFCNNISFGVAILWQEFTVAGRRNETVKKLSVF